MIINSLTVLTSPFFKLIFYVTADNVYQRGLMFFVPVLTAYFYLLISFIFIYKNREEIEAVMDRVSNAFREYNSTSNNPYELSFSYGYELYDLDRGMTVDAYISNVDELMYRAKHEKKDKMNG